MDFIRNIQDPSADDAQLVRRYKETGELQWLSLLYQRYMDLVYGACLKYLKDAETSKDAVMNIFEELIPKLKAHDPQNFRAWLYTVSRNHCLMQLRTPKNLKTTELHPDFVQFEEEGHLNGVLEKEEQLGELRRCLETLVGEQKTALDLFYLQQRSYQEIALATGMEWNKVRSHIQNGRRNLKICMEKKTSALKDK